MEKSNVNVPGLVLRVVLSTGDKRGCRTLGCFLLEGVELARSLFLGGAISCTFHRGHRSRPVAACTARSTDCGGAHLRGGRLVVALHECGISDVKKVVIGKKLEECDGSQTTRLQTRVRAK